MKAKIRKTGEIVEIISYSGGTVRSNILDSVSYIDSKGIEHNRENLNYYWDFEQIPDVKEDNCPKIDWEQRRYEIAKAIISARVATADCIRTHYLVTTTMEIVDELISELKKGLSNERI